MLLDGLRVLDFSIWRPGPYATQLLAELGADVLKVEPPGGDPMRQYVELFATLHANKRSIVLDLKDDADRERAHELGRDADVVIEGYRPGVAARLSIGYDDLKAVNPRVVYCSISGMGQTGPLSAASGHDLNYMAWSGALSPDGRAPAEPAIPVADLAGGMAGALQICAAVVQQRRTGEGTYLDVAMADVLATWTGPARPTAQGADPDARGVPGYGTFEAADGWITLGIISEDHFWRPLCDALDMSDVRELGFLDRMQRFGELQHRIADAIRTRQRDALVTELLGANVPVAPVLNRTEMMALDHFQTRGAVIDRGRAPTLGEHQGQAWLVS